MSVGYEMYLGNLDDDGDIVLNDAVREVAGMLEAGGVWYEEALPRDGEVVLTHVDIPGPSSMDDTAEFEIVIRRRSWPDTTAEHEQHTDRDPSCKRCTEEAGRGGGPPDPHADCDVDENGVHRSWCVAVDPLSP